jgi:hypothetical protein
MTQDELWQVLNRYKTQYLGLSEVRKRESLTLPDVVEVNIQQRRITEKILDLILYKGNECTGIEQMEHHVMK